MEAGRQHFGKPASIFLLSGKVLNTMLHPLNTMLHPLHPLLKSLHRCHKVVILRIDNGQ